MNHDVFISYSSRNRTTAVAICHVLESHGIKCWIAPRDLPPGSDYGDEIDAAIASCRLFVMVFSEPATMSMWVRGELNTAFSLQKYIIPYRIDPTPLKGAMRVILNQMHWVDAYPDAESKFGELARMIARLLDMPATAGPISETVGPYAAGDYYCENGRQGIVFETDASGLHGKIVSLNERCCVGWSTESEFEKRVMIGAVDRQDGMKNLRAVMQIPGWREKYPAFAWCADQGEGWYLPARDELERFMLDDSLYEAVDGALALRQGVLLSDLSAEFSDGDEDADFSYWTSTEEDAYGAWNIYRSGRCRDLFYDRKCARYRVRPVAAF